MKTLLPQATLRNKLVALSFSLLLVIVLLVFGVVHTQQTRLLQTQWSESLHAQARLLAINSQAAVAFLDVREANSLLDSLAGNPAIVAGRTLIDGRPWAEYRRPGTAAEAFPRTSASTLFGEDHLFVREDVILIAGEPPAAQVELLVSLASYHQTMQKARNEILLLLVLALLGALGLTHLAVRRLTAPIEDLNQVVARISGRGSLAERVVIPARAEDEISRLGLAFNGMLDKLEARDSELERYRENLERLVDQRTIALQDAMIEAKEASRAKSAFLARMSHEIRTPMNAIIGLSRMVLEGELAPAQREHLEQIMQSSDALLGILNDILDYSKIEAGRLTLERAPFQVEKLLHSLRGIFAVKAREKGLTLRFSIAPDVPPVVLGDSLRLGQILINLVGNALKFTEEGEIEVGIRCLDRVSGDVVALEFSVRDTGIGIPEDRQELLFLPFMQADDSITRRFGGTGLGLAISRQLTELMGGEIRLASTPGAGSTFSFIVRLTVADTATTQSLLEQKAPGAAPALPQWQGERILLVEDVALNRTIAQALLRKVGLAVVTAVNGQEALDCLDREEAPPIALVLMDIQMPVMDGLTATRRLRADPRFAHLPIIAMTAHAMTEDREESRAAGMNEHLVKPIIPAELYSTLARWLPPAA